MIILIIMNINLDTRIYSQPALLQFLIPGPLRYKYVAPSRNRHPRTDEQVLIWVSGPRQRRTDRSRSEFQDLNRRMDGRTDLDFQDLDRRTDRQGN
jgi:hypothetical protein